MQKYSSINKCQYLVLKQQDTDSQSLKLIPHMKSVVMCMNLSLFSKKSKSTTYQTTKSHNLAHTLNLESKWILFKARIWILFLYKVLYLNKLNNCSLLAWLTNFKKIWSFSIFIPSIMITSYSKLKLTLKIHN